MSSAPTKYDLIDSLDDDSKGFNFQTWFPFTDKKERTLLIIEASIEAAFLALFAIFIWGVDSGCDSAYMTYAKFAFFTLIAYTAFQTFFINLVSVSWPQVVDKTWTYYLGVVIFFIMIVTMLYSWVYGVVVVAKDGYSEACGGLYYLTAIYLIALTIEVGLRFIAPFIAAPLGYWCFRCCNESVEDQERRERDEQDRKFEENLEEELKNQNEKDKRFAMEVKKGDDEAEKLVGEENA